jgi:predicted metal-dependent phosphoesterase TrpH
LIRADLHIHTCYSVDCFTSLDAIVDRCLQIGIGCVAVADHNTIAGARTLREIAPFKVIVAEEIQTTAGEIMGVFLEERVPPGLSPDETISRIRAQGGLVCIPHPYGRTLLGNPNSLTSAAVLSRVDIIEVFNSRTPLSRSNDAARRLAVEHHKAASAGSDAHTPGEIGRAYVEMPEFEGPADFLASLAHVEIRGQRSSYSVHLFSTWARVRRVVFGGPAGSSPSAREDPSSR